MTYNPFREEMNICKLLGDTKAELDSCSGRRYVLLFYCKCTCLHGLRLPNADDEGDFDQISNYFHLLFAFAREGLIERAADPTYGGKKH